MSDIDKINAKLDHILNRNGERECGFNTNVPDLIDALRIAVAYIVTYYGEDSIPLREIAEKLGGKP
jgi:hypothetical protein